MGRLLVIDGGRSRCRAAVAGGARREPVGEGRGLPPTNAPEGLSGVVQAVGETVALCAVNSETIDAVCAGLAGMLGSLDRAPEVAEGLSRLIGVERVVLTGDIVIAYAGALGLRPGVVVSAGSGAVALAASEEGTARTDGWGHVLGDAGSGYWIGRRGLEAALRAHDGRGGSALLAGLVECHIGPLDMLPARIEGPSAVAAFAVHVAEAARRGDDLARHIWLEAAAELANTTAACARHLFRGGEEVPVSWSGGLFSAAGDLLLDPFLARLTELLPEAAPSTPVGDPLSGAVVLAGTTERGLLAPLVYDSGREPLRLGDNRSQVLT